MEGVLYLRQAREAKTILFCLCALVLYKETTETMAEVFTTGGMIGFSGLLITGNRPMNEGRLIL
jgi:hypothetical protein